MNAMKTVFPLETVQSKAAEGSAPYAGLFSVEGREQPLVYYTDIRFLVPNSIDQMRMLTGQRGADRSRMREAFTELTGADPVTGLPSSICACPSPVTWVRAPGRPGPASA